MNFHDLSAQHIFFEINNTRSTNAYQNKNIPVSNYKQDDIYRNKNSSAFLPKIPGHHHPFPWLSMTFHDFPWPWLFSMTFQAWKIVLLNSMTFQEEWSPWKSHYMLQTHTTAEIIEITVTLTKQTSVSQHSQYRKSTFLSAWAMVSSRAGCMAIFSLLL